MKKSLPNFKGSVKGWSIVLAVIFCNSVFAQVPTTKQVAGLKTTQKPVKAKTRVNSKNNIIKNAIYLDKQRSNKKTLVPTPYSTRGFLPTQSIKRSSTSIKSTSKTIFHAINSRKLNTRSASAFPIEIFSEDFSSADSIPAGWSNVDMNDTGLVWQWNSGMSNGEFPATLDPVTSSSADGYVMFDSDGQGMSYGGELSFLTTPVINCSTNTFVYGELNHYFKRHINNKGYLLVSTDSTNWDTIFTAHAGLGINRGTDNADNTGGDISGFAANEPKVWFRFMWEGDYDYYWFIDDFRIYEPEIKDVSITDMSDHDPLYCDQYADSIRVEITNLGNDTVFGLTIGFSKNFGVANTYTISDTIPPDSTIYYVIPKTINFNSDKTTDFSVFTMLAGDDFTNNDSIFFDAKATNGSHVVTDGTFNLGFEVIEEDYKWGVEDANGDGWGWGQVTGNPNFARAGDGYMLYFNDNTSPFYTGVADDWFYTQCLFLDTGVTYKLTFDYYPFSDEGFDIMLGRAADPDSMTIVINNWNVTTANGYDTYENANITVAQPGDYHLGFHIITGINSYAVIIDEIEVDTVPKIDIGVISIDAPALNCSYGSGDTVKVTIQNFGTDAVSNFTVTYKAPGVEES
ncbi:MAG: hypothetical protein JKX95_03345, partial [Bacteroidia bacterium]|nr:hypothetical protein [Bacteroidia bacterium]